MVRILLTTSKISILQSAEPSVKPNQRLGPLPPCTLKWRQKQLWVKALPANTTSDLPSLQDEEWLTECLKHSSARLVCLDPTLGAGGLRRWADACEKAKKSVFLRVPMHPQLRQQNSFVEWSRQLLDRIIAAILLTVLCPLLLMLIVLLRIDAPESIFFCQWRVGRRGKLFRLIRFRIQDTYRRGDRPHITPLRRWIRRLGLEGLPQLFNVLQGEMSLVGRCTWDLYDASRLNCEKRQELRILPGIIAVSPSSMHPIGSNA
jgi:lipopolysaccharide/colanic/teichoic acid biosynthesis glycosyltransferase